MAEIAKINKVNIYKESLGDNQINYELIQDNVPIGTDINIEPTINSGSFLLKGAETLDGSIQLGTTNGITATAEGGLIANSVTANKLILENGNNDIDVKNALKSVSLTVTDNNGLVVTGTTLNGDEIASSEASITFPEITDEKVKNVLLSSSDNQDHPLLLGKAFNSEVNNAYYAPYNLLSYNQVDGLFCNCVSVGRNTDLGGSPIKGELHIRNGITGDADQGIHITGTGISSSHVPLFLSGGTNGIYLQDNTRCARLMSGAIKIITQQRQINYGTATHNSVLLTISNSRAGGVPTFDDYDIIGNHRSCLIIINESVKEKSEYSTTVFSIEDIDIASYNTAPADTTKHIEFDHTINHFSKAYWGLTVPGNNFPNLNLLFIAEGSLGEGILVDLNITYIFYN